MSDFVLIPFQATNYFSAFVELFLADCLFIIKIVY
jgi:hypothetical protein